MFGVSRRLNSLATRTKPNWLPCRGIMVTKQSMQSDLEVDVGPALPERVLEECILRNTPITPNIPVHAEQVEHAMANSWPD